MYRYAANNPVKYTDPTGLYTKEQISDFRKKTAEEQLKFLQKEVESAKENGLLAMGAKSAEIRNDLVSRMKLRGLFKQDRNFMNIELRDFLNLKEDGTMNYKLSELVNDPNWEEYSSLFSKYHQTREEKKLSAKFVHKDGREVIITYQGYVLLNYPDKGTFNYRKNWLGHLFYDINPYDDLMIDSGYKTKSRYYGFFKGGFWRGNSKYW